MFIKFVSMLVAVVYCCAGATAVEMPALSSTIVMSTPDSERSSIVGDLKFTVTSLRISKEPPGFQSWASIFLMIENMGSKDITLNYLRDKSSLINERGYKWRPSRLKPIGLEADGYGPTTVGGHEKVYLTIPLFYSSNNPGQTVGGKFDFSAAFGAYSKADDEGRVAQVGVYDVRIKGVTKSIAPNKAGAEISGGADKELRIGNFGFKLYSIRTSNEITRYDTLSRATAILSVVNHGDTSEEVVFQRTKAILVDEFGHVWADDYDRAATGLPTVEGSTGATGVAFLQPGEESYITVPLSRKLNQARIVGKTFDLGLEFTAIENLGEGAVRRKRTYPIHFTGVRNTSAYYASNVSSKTQSPQSYKPELQVDKLKFQLTAFSTSEEDAGGGVLQNVARISLEITNEGSEPISLNCLYANSNLVDENGSTWRVPLLRRHELNMAEQTNNSASLESTIRPHESIGVTIPLERLVYFPPVDDRKVGEFFDLSLEFSEYNQGDEGMLHKTNSYSVAFVNIEKSAMAGLAAQSIQDIGGQLKRGLGGLFGR